MKVLNLLAVLVFSVCLNGCGAMQEFDNQDIDVDVQDVQYDEDIQEEVMSLDDNVDFVQSKLGVSRVSLTSSGSLYTGGSYDTVINHTFNLPYGIEGNVDLYIYTKGDYQGSHKRSVVYLVKGASEKYIGTHTRNNSCGMYVSQKFTVPISTMLAYSLNNSLKIRIKNERVRGCRTSWGQNMNTAYHYI